MLNRGRMYRRAQRGSSLIEVLISIAIVVLVLVTIASTSSIVTRNRRFSAEQAAATTYSQEAVEWVRQLRGVMGWKAFAEAVYSKGAVVVLCFNTLPTTAVAFSALATGNCAEDAFIGTTIYQREVQLTSTPPVLPATVPSEIYVEGFVDWKDNNLDRQVFATAVLKEWE